MVYVIVGILLGIIVGIKTNVTYNPVYTIYVSLIVLAIINTIFNILAENSKQEMSNKNCLIILCGDILIALLLGFIGEQLGLPLYLAAIFAFGNNIYMNLKTILHNYLYKKNI